LAFLKKNSQPLRGTRVIIYGLPRGP